MYFFPLTFWCFLSFQQFYCNFQNFIFKLLDSKLVKNHHSYYFVVLLSYALDFWVICNDSLFCFREYYLSTVLISFKLVINIECIYINNLFVNLKGLIEIWPKFLLIIGERFWILRELKRCKRYHMNFTQHQILIICCFFLL